MRLQTDLSSKRAERQQGFVLVTAVIFIFVLSALAVMALRGSVFEERMSANDRDVAVAREYAEMALRDAERDILGIRFDGTFCASGSPGCETLRPATTRPTDATESKGFWDASSIASAEVDIALDDGGATQTDVAYKGVYTMASATACGKPVWSAADWDDGISRTCSGTITTTVPTIEYGTFTDAPFVGPDGNAPQGIPAPRYIIEMMPGIEVMGKLSNSSKVFFRITAVGFGRTVSPLGGRTSVTLQSVFSPL